MAFSLKRIHYVEHSLGEIGHEYPNSILLEPLLEGLSELQHGRSSAELGALHHALLIIHKKVSTAGQYIASLLRSHLGSSMLGKVCHKTIHQLTQVSVME